MKAITKFETVGWVYVAIALLLQVTWITWVSKLHTSMVLDVNGHP